MVTLESEADCAKRVERRSTSAHSERVAAPARRSVDSRLCLAGPSIFLLLCLRILCCERFCSRETVVAIAENGRGQPPTRAVPSLLPWVSQDMSPCSLFIDGASDLGSRTL